MAYFAFLNIVFAPLLKLPPLLAIIILALFVSITVILTTKFMTDQTLMKKLKDDIKEHQKQIKESKANPAKAMELQKKSMELNMKYMTHSLKPTIITFIPIILIFSWMSATFAFDSIKPQQEFSVIAVFDENANGNAELIVPEGIAIIGNKTRKIENNKAEWTLKGEEGEHLLEFAYNDEKQQHSVLITNKGNYLSPTKKTDGVIKSIYINYKKLIVLPIGYKDWLGWLGTYIWSSIIFTMLLRKVMKIY